MNRITDAILQNLQTKCAENNGRLIKVVFKGRYPIAVIKCANNHIFTPHVSNLLKGTWCGKCFRAARAAARRADTYSRAVDIASSKGGRCLSAAYTRENEKLEFKCKITSHPSWWANPSTIISGYWCKKCATDKLSDVFRGPFSDILEVIKSKNGRLISCEYKNRKSPITIQCLQPNHPEWTTTVGQIKIGTWCPDCAKIQRRKTRLSRLSIYDLQKWAAIKGGWCLSTEYVGIKGRYLWKCKANHTWPATADSIQRGSWCDKCANLGGTRGRFPRMNSAKIGKALNAKNIVITGGIYRNQTSRLSFRCKICDYNWTAAAGPVVTRTGCARCAGTLPLDISEAQALAQRRGGRLVSTVYQSARKPLIWECCHKHQWPAPIYRIKAGGWCPECSSRLGERICREYFEQIFSAQFPRTKALLWLVNATGNRMELDGYCEPLKLAFEHQGEYHFSKAGYYSPTEAHLASRKRDDQIKVRLCRKHGVRLFVIPEVPNLTRIQDLKTTIRKEAQRLKVKLPVDFQNRTIDLLGAYTSTAFSKLLEICRQRGGRCLSKQYFGAKVHLNFECHVGHTWPAVPDSIMHGTWCPKCSQKGRRAHRK